MSTLDEVDIIAKEVFDAYDKDGDGVIGKSELKKLLDDVSKRLNLPKVTNKDIIEGLKYIDDNSDGVLDFNEFLPYYREIYSALKSAK